MHQFSWAMFTGLKVGDYLQYPETRAGRTFGPTQTFNGAAVSLAISLLHFLGLPPGL